MKIPSVSIITPLYNSEKYISEAINSVISQTYSDWEMIIVDDLSTDDSVRIVLSFCNLDERVKLIKLENNSGAAVARNKAIEACKGRYIAFLDSDDSWRPEKLERQLCFMKKNNFRFSFSAYEKINEEGEVKSYVHAPGKVNYKSLLKSNVIGCLTAMYDSEYFGKRFFPLIRKRQDYALWLDLLRNAEYAHGMNETLAFYRERKGSISSNKWNAATYNWRIYTEVEDLGKLKSVYYFVHYLIRGCLKNYFPNVANFLRM